MNIGGKGYRYISIAYFVIHCLHLILMVIASFLPYVDSKNAYQFFKDLWQFLCVGFTLLALGCFFAWRTINCRPYYCILAFVLTIVWDLGIFYAVGLVGLGLAFGAQATLGFGLHIFSYGMLLICVDIAYILYMLVLLFVTPKEKMKN